MRTRVAVLSVVALGTLWVACSSGGGGVIDSGDAGDGGRGEGGALDAAGDASGDATAAGCPASPPQDESPCSMTTQKSCSYGCDRGGPASATCENGKWNVGYLDVECPPPPADGPFACGASTCSATQYCVHPCCGGPAPQCLPLPDSGVCPAGSSPGSCPGGTTGCVEDPCTPAPPYCIDDGDPPAGCSANGSGREFHCQCA